MNNHAKHHQFGTTSLGEKGQVVIPADIRASLNLEKGEKLIVLAKGKGITLIPASHFARMTEHLAEVKKLLDAAA